MFLIKGSKAPHHQGQQGSSSQRAAKLFSSRAARLRIIKGSEALLHQGQLDPSSSGAARLCLIRGSEAPHQGQPDPSSPGAARLCLTRGRWTLPRHEQRGSASLGAAGPFLARSSEDLPHQGQPDRYQIFGTIRYSSYHIFKVVRYSSN